MHRLVLQSETEKIKFSKLSDLGAIAKIVKFRQIDFEN